MSKRKQAARIKKPAVAPAATKPTRRLFPLWWVIGLLVLTGFVFWPILHNQFTNWDDEAYVVTNSLLRGPDWTGIFSQPVVSNYHPLTVLSLALNYQVSRLEPFSYFFINWALHLANTGLVFYLVWLISGRISWVALFTALVFAVHPMHVESVAWVSERKDVLYTLFYLLALLQYWRYQEHGRRTDWWLTLGWFVLSLLSKPAAVVLPLSLLLLDYWRGRLQERRLWLEKLPFLALSLAFGVGTLLIQSEKAMVTLDKYSLVDRLFFGCYGLVMYLVRFFVPAPLSAFHPYPLSGQLGWAIQLAPLALLALVAGVWYFRKNKALVFGALFYVVNIVLVVQFIAIGNTLLSERYTYVPYIGVAFALAMLAQQRNQPVLKWGLLAVPALVFGFLSNQRTRVWQDSETLWTDAIKTYPEAPIPRSNRANDLYRQSLLPANAQKSGEIRGRALADCNATLSVKPDHFGALDIRSLIYLRTGKYDDALRDANAMIQVRPDGDKGYVTRGSIYLPLRRYDEALADFNRILEKDSSNTDALNGRGTALFNGRQQYREALADFDKAISIKQDGMYYLNRSRCYLMLGELPKARDDAQTAQRLGTPVSKDYLKTLNRNNQ